MTNSAGRMLEPELIVVSRPAKGASGPPYREANSAPEPKSAAGAAAVTPAKKGKGAPKGKNMVRAEVAARKAQKDEDDAAKIVGAWKVKRASIDSVADLMSRYARAEAYLQSLPSVKCRVLHADILLYQLQVLMAVWADYCKAGKKSEGCPTAALACHILLQLAECPSGMTQDIADEVGGVALSLGVPLHAFTPRNTVESRFSFDSKVATSSRTVQTKQLTSTTPRLQLPMDWTEFQLMHYGPYMERDFDSAPDPRVSFEPDGWQRQVLDELDADNSVFVVAPTSAGKTFISFYAMEKVLRESDDAVLVYVAPTKALVSQIAAEIQARFRKTYSQPGKCMWAISTRDYKYVPSWRFAGLTFPFCSQTSLT
jgi:superfamily II RNA helicase